MAILRHRLYDRMQVIERKRDKIICKIRYFASNFASKVEKHEILLEKSYSRFFVEFYERKSNLF